ncbi:hypothetical protein V1478_018378 [Vespula squamosa]|uniref:Uncharacterized protein n=1 Tax=Vespula squamosa TaxID=30214 RepID=A0ABD1ZUW6_VESSQ
MTVADFLFHRLLFLSPSHNPITRSVGPRPIGAYRSEDFSVIINLDSSKYSRQPGTTLIYEIKRNGVFSNEIASNDREYGLCPFVSIINHIQRFVVFNFIPTEHYLLPSIKEIMQSRHKSQLGQTLVYRGVPGRGLFGHTLLVVLLSWNDWNLYYLESFHDGGKSIKKGTCIFETSLERIVFSTWLFSGKQANLYEGSIKSSIGNLSMSVNAATVTRNVSKRNGIKSQLRIL